MATNGAQKEMLEALTNGVEKACVQGEGERGRRGRGLRTISRGFLPVLQVPSWDAQCGMYVWTYFLSGWVLEHPLPCSPLVLPRLPQRLVGHVLTQ